MTSFDDRRHLLQETDSPAFKMSSPQRLHQQP